MRDDIPSLIQEGYRLDDAGHLILTSSVDFRDPEHRTPISTLLKLCEKQYAPENLGTIRISKPPLFRNCGETLISDPGEARVSRVTQHTELVDDAHYLAEEQLRADEANRAAELAGANIKRAPARTKRTATIPILSRLATTDGFSARRLRRQIRRNMTNSGRR